MALIYNPVSGMRRDRRLPDVDTAASVLRNAGVEAVAIPTTAVGSGGTQAREAAQQGCDTIIACGGDGTVHDVLQGLVSTPTPLGLLPLGTGNALATDLRLSRDPARAARQLLDAEPTRIAVGKAEFSRGGAQACRYFTVIAGVGADAMMLYSLNIEFKKRYGMTAYYAAAARLFAMYPFVPFEIELNGTRERVYQVMAVRVQHFGGVLRRLAPEAGLLRRDLAFALFRSRSRWVYLLYVIRGFLQQRWAVPGVRVIHATEAVCRPLPEPEQQTLYAEADGELLGGLPVRISIV
ncbi:MAG: NAD(+)/NADH kinase, partial [Acidobacteria bacterium]|nr:NAD(+)/NADH kinase [Acidobacteriota bacterium]